MKNYLKLIIQSAIIASIFASIGYSSAAMVETQSLIKELKVEVERDQLIQLLERDSVRTALVAKGVNMDDAVARVGAMTEQEVSLLANHLESLPAGAGVGSVAVTVLLVLIILDILGVTNIFTFIR